MPLTKRQKDFLRGIRDCANVGEALRLASGASRSTLSLWRKDPEFAAEYALAKDDALESLEAEAIRRANGWTGEDKDGNPVFRHSDRLMEFLLKAYNPARYRDNYKAQDAPSATEVQPLLEGLAAAILQAREEGSGE